MLHSLHYSTPQLHYNIYLIYKIRESSFNMTREEGNEDIEGGGGGSENFYTPEGGALKN